MWVSYTKHKSIRLCHTHTYLCITISLDSAITFYVSRKNSRRWYTSVISSSYCRCYQNFNYNLSTSFVISSICCVYSLPKFRIDNNADDEEKNLIANLWIVGNFEFKQVSKKLVKTSKKELNFQNNQQFCVFIFHSILYAFLNKLTFFGNSRSWVQTN